MNFKLLRKLSIITKLTLMAFCLQLVAVDLAWAENNTQEVKSIYDVKIQLKKSQRTLQQVFRDVEKQTDFVFSYLEEDMIRKNSPLDLSGNNSINLADLLLKVSQQHSLKFKQVNRVINVIPIQKNQKASKIEVIIQSKTVSGEVIDQQTEEPLPGVNVVEKGTTNGTVTNINGEYTLNISDNATLVFSSVGYTQEEVQVGDRSVIDMAMVEDIQQLQELVVVGYGTEKKVNLTGAVGVTSGEVLEQRPIPNVGEGLQGVVPNLNVNIRNGDPSQPIDFNIRGFESINGGSPLILVDGVPMDLNRINPTDIESVSVLKDAAAAAVYGARAAFGVVLVTTKEGSQNEKINVNFTAEAAMSNPIFFIDPVNDPHQFVLARNMATMRTNGAPAYDQDYIDGTQRWVENPTLENRWGVLNGTLRHYGYNNYVDQLITDFAPQQRYDLSVSGGTENSSYYVSFGHLSKDGYLKNSEKNESYKRYNTLLKGNFEVTDWLNLESRALVSMENSDKPHFYHWDVNINTSARQNPLDMIRFPDLDSYVTPGDRENYEQYIGMYFGGTNFLPYLEDGGRQTWNRQEITLTQVATVTPVKNLNIRGQFSGRFTNREFEDVQSKIEVVREGPNLLEDNLIDNGFSGNDWIENRTDNDQYYVLIATADYSIETDNGHTLKAMVGFNQEWGRFEYIRARAFKLISPQIADINATTGNQEAYGGKQHTALRGAFYRLNYIFKDKYLIEANGRYDGTSRFPKDSRFGFFPSISVGWRISEEPFMSGFDNWLDNFKIRASYGELGNQLLGNNYYPYIPTMGTGNSSYMMASGSRTPFVSAAGLVSPSLTWETVTTQNLGIDFTVLNNRLDVSFDVYTRDTKDMLTDVEYPDILGTSAPDANAADLRTRGWELAATWRNRINQDLDYNITLAFSDNNAEITKYDNPTGSLNERYVGQQIGERWGYITEGIFQTEDEIAAHADQTQVQDGANWRPGDIKYRDLNGDGVINTGDGTLENPGDRTIIAYETPRYQYGLNNTVNWKNFSLNVFFQGLLKHDYWPPNNNWVAFYPFNAGHVEQYYLTDTWSEDNPDAYFPAPHISTNTKQNVQPQSRYVQNGAYLRLRNLTFSYSLPTELTNRIGMARAQIYFAGTNLWEYTTMRKPLDPEVRPTLTQEYYKQRTYALGVRVSL